MHVRILPLVLVFSSQAFAQPPTAESIVKAAIDHWRGKTSDTVVEMVIHRPDWERSMTIRGWSKGDEKSLIRVLEPRKDRGTSTLIDGDNMWTFAPKINRIIKVPSSMMGQSWMGSDFSNKDVARADDIVDQYAHKLVGVDEVDGTTIYEIESVPYEDAPVVWGKETLRIREDHIVLEHRFFDQDGELVKILASLEIGELNGRTLALRQRMNKIETPDAWTEIRLQSAMYDIELKDNLFTLASLRRMGN